MILPARSLLHFALPALLAPAGLAQSFQGIGDLAGGAFESSAVGVSADGRTVVGQSVTAGGKLAVYWRDGVLVALGDLAGGALESVAVGANLDGSILVGRGKDATADRALRWDGPAYGMTQLPLPAGHTAAGNATGISMDGKTISGWATNSQLTSYSSVTGFRIDSGVLTALPYMVPSQPGSSDSGAYNGPSADGSVLVGRIRTGGIQYRGCYWKGSTLHVPPSLDALNNYSQIFGASADGNVRVGHSQSNLVQPNLTGEPCRWVGDVPQGLGGLAGGDKSGAATSTNNDGSVVVGYSNVGGSAIRAFLWTPAAGMRDLASVLTNDYGLNLAGWTLEGASMITPDGSVIVGNGTNPSGFMEGWIATLGCATSTSLCTAKTNSPGCVPMIFGTGIPSATATGGFVVRATQMLNNMPGLLIYGFNGAAALPFQGGTLCVGSPVFRTSGLNSGGSPAGADCTGVYSLDMNAFAHGLLGGTPQPNLTVPGTTVNCQFWGRDTGFTAPNNSQLSNGLRFEICD
jgi:probable HAF family extracellular repeat protein